MVPVYNEQDSLDTLVREIREVAAAQDYDVHLLFVDDGSTDASWLRIKTLAEANPAIGGLRFRRNEGKAAALMAGFAATRGDVVFTMDADLQDPPQEMPRLIERLDQGYDVVSGYKQRRLDPWHKVYPSRVFNRIIGLLTGVHLHDHVCGLKVYRRKVLPDLRIYGELHRFLGVLAAAHGHRVTEIPTLHRARTSGVGKYGFSRFAKGFLDLITVLTLTRFRWRPQHLIGVIGLWVVVGGSLVALESLLLPSRVLSALIVPLLGVLLIAVGLVAELIVAERPLGSLYEIAERTGWCTQQKTASQLDPVAVSHDHEL
ncbi:MAG: glycosyltransferase family 2 protein [Phycisphaerae bacterium]|nr:glycosyltransferase family 2 protein [Phycisphaerae bacterium]